MSQISLIKKCAQAKKTVETTQFETEGRCFLMTKTQVMASCLSEGSIIELDGAMGEVLKTVRQDKNRKVTVRIDGKQRVYNWHYSQDVWSVFVEEV